MLRRKLIQFTWRFNQKYNPPLLWSKGFSRYCDFKGPDSYWHEDTESCQSKAFFRRYYSDASGLVWVRLSTRSRKGMPCDLDNFVRGALPAIREPFALITTDGDASVPSDSEERCRAIAALRTCDHVDFLSKRISQTAIRRRYAGYPFVVSAPGYGLDCHRTWEVLYLGSIVITKRSSLDGLFEGLPVVLVDDWKEIGDKQNLSKWLRQYSKLTDRDVLWSRLEPGNLTRPIREALAKF